MVITSKYLHKLMESAGSDTLHSEIIRDLLVLKAELPHFGNMERTLEEHDGKRIAVYTITIEQAIMVVTNLNNASMVYLVRELIRLEEGNDLKLDERITEIESRKLIKETIEYSFSDLGKILSLQSASLDRVDVTKRAILGLTSDNKHRGVCTLYTLKELLSQSTGVDLSVHTVLSLIIKHAKGYKLQLTKEQIGKVHVPLVWLSEYLDLIMLDILSGVKMNTEQSAEVARYLGD